MKLHNRLSKYCKGLTLAKLLVVLILLAATLFIVDKSFFKRAELNEKLSENTQSAEGFSVQITRINIEAPIVLNVDAANKTEYFKALENGVAHMKGSVLPGEVGNSFIFGHSSFYESSIGNYKDIFKNLNDLEAKDKIFIFSSGKKITFVVEDKKIVKPDDLSVLSNSTDSILTILTCWPVGTTDSRLIIRAKREN